MTIRMNSHARLGGTGDGYSGATADVFDVEGLAYKVFRVRGVANPLEFVEARFKAECEAYRLASSDAWLRRHVPAFHGTATIDDVRNGLEESVAADYALHCCYRIELPRGIERKVTEIGLREANPHLKEAQDRFKALGVDILDASVFNVEDSERFKIIDFR